MLKNSYTGFLGLSPATSVQFTLKMCAVTGNHEKFTKTPYFESSSSFNVRSVDSPKKHVTRACYNKQHICVYLQPFLRWSSQQW